jgi:hypothetical protein
VTNLAIVNASIGLATSAIFIDGQSLLGLVPGVIILFGITPLPFHIFVGRKRL